MIEITHKQAQHLIREGLERRLPDAQWAMLQSHLENCAECTAYRQRLVASQRGLTHALRLRWGGARGPRPGTTKYLLALRERREKQRVLIGKAARVAMVLVLFVAYLVYRKVTAPPPTARPTAAATLAGEATTVEPTATPEITFRGLVAYEEQQEGSADIVLLNVSGGQVDRSNLTQSEAVESSPAWSPDGEWIAFLSDRSGKNEIYLMTVAGSRLTQISDEPGVEWQGPLEWSYDGDWIALTGRRADAGGDPFLYLVSTTGQEPQSIAYTRGARPWARFSPALPLLAFPSIEPGGGLSVINIETGWTARVTAEDTDFLRYGLDHPEAFDWSLGGRSLVYTAGTAAESLLRISPELDARNINDFTGTGAQSIASEGPGTFSAITWVPNSLLVASLEMTENGCRTIRLDHAYNRQVTPRRLPGLCVEGSLERASWSGDGSWLVLLARLPEESTPAIYAVRIPEDGDPALYERLGEVGLMDGSLLTDESLPLGPALRVRKIGRNLAINPIAAEPQPEASGPAPTAAPVPTEGLPEWVYYTVKRGQNGQLFRARPDGSQTEPLGGSNASVTCPRVGPDGRVAYLSNMGRGETISRELFVMDGEGHNHSLLTREGNDRIYDCPVWSPDGRYLAAFANQLGVESLAVVRTDGSAPPFFLPVDLRGLSEPIWLPNDPADPSQGADKLLVIVPQAREPVRLLEYDISLPEGARETPRLRAMLTGWDDIWGAALSPDGQQLAMVPILLNLNTNLLGRTSAQLRIMDLQTLNVMVNEPLRNFDPYTVGRGGLVWLPDGQLGLVRSTSMISNRKSMFEIFGRVEGFDNPTLMQVGQFEDVVFGVDWIASAEMREGVILFSAESGLWIVYYGPDGSRPPVQLSSEVITGVDWK